MKIHSRLTVRILFTIITLSFIALTYISYDSSVYQEAPEVTFALGVITLFCTYQLIEIFSLHIKIQDGKLKIKSIKPKESGLTALALTNRSYVFNIADIKSIKIEYAPVHHNRVYGVVTDPYIGKGRAMLVIEIPSGTSKILLDSFNVKKVEKFVATNFPNLAV